MRWLALGRNCLAKLLNRAPTSACAALSISSASVAVVPPRMVPSPAQDERYLHKCDSDTGRRWASKRAETLSKGAGRVSG